MINVIWIHAKNLERQPPTKYHHVNTNNDHAHLESTKEGFQA